MGTAPDLAVHGILLAFPEWAPHVLTAESRHRDTQNRHEANLVVSYPANGPQHELSIRSFGNTVKVSYTDGQSSGPAEAEFLVETGADLLIASVAATAFIKSLAAGEVQVVREGSLHGRSQLGFAHRSQAVPSGSELMRWRETWG